MTLLLLYSGGGVTTTITGTLGVIEAADIAAISDALLPIVLDLVASQDTGSSSTDDITADTSPDLDILFPNGTNTGDIFKIYDGATLLGTHTMTAGEVSARAFAMSLSALATGPHSLTATVTRGANLSPPSPALSITITPTPP
jgi:hypothetical protein